MVCGVLIKVNWDWFDLADDGVGAILETNSRIEASIFRISEVESAEREKLKWKLGFEFLEV